MASLLFTFKNAVGLATEKEKGYYETKAALDGEKAEAERIVELKAQADLDLEEVAIRTAKQKAEADRKLAAADDLVAQAAAEAAWKQADAQLKKNDADRKLIEAAIEAKRMRAEALAAAELARQNAALMKLEAEQALREDLIKERSKVDETLEQAARRAARAKAKLDAEVAEAAREAEAEKAKASLIIEEAAREAARKRAEADKMRLDASRILDEAVRTAEQQRMEVENARLEAEAKAARRKAAADEVLALAAEKAKNECLDAELKRQQMLAERKQGIAEALHDMHIQQLQSTQSVLQKIVNEQAPETLRAHAAVTQELRSHDGSAKLGKTATHVAVSRQTAA